MKFGVVKKSTIVNKFVLHTLQRNITHLAVITHKTNIKLGVLKGGNWKKAQTFNVWINELTKNQFLPPTPPPPGYFGYFIRQLVYTSAGLYTAQLEICLIIAFSKPVLSPRIQFPLAQFIYFPIYKPKLYLYTALC